ncbi:hypothetical protein B1F70_11400, partial [Pseudomonas syringae]
ASFATPHSQRSVATVQVRMAEQAAELGLMTLIDLVEQALGTPGEVCSCASFVSLANFTTRAKPDVSGSQPCSARP